METIKSPQNTKIKELAKLLQKASLREERGLFLGEGVRFVKDAPDSSIEEVFVTETLFERIGREDRAFREKLGRLTTTLVSDAVLEKLSDTKSPQGIVSLHKRPAWGAEDLLSGNPLILVLEGIQDPGNLGTMVRTAEAAGASGILADRGTVELTSPKVVRSTMGAIFRVPFVRTDDLPGAVKALKERGVRVFAAHLEGSSVYTEGAFTGPSAILIGNEGRGLTPEITALSDERVRIPMAGQIESLNASVSAAILLYEAARQRREGGSGR